MQGITGKLSGKMGSAVFRVRNGAQVVTQYNPIVKNPDTAGQQEARAKFKLLSQLGAIMESGFGTMAVSKRPGKSAPTQRNAFMQLNYPLVAVDNTADTPERATIPMERVQLTKSSRPLGTIGNNQGAVSVSDMPAEVANVRFVIVGYRQFQEVDPDSGSFIIKVKPEVRDIVDIPAVDGKADLGAVSDYGVKVTVLAYGMIPSASAAGRVNFDSIHTPADEDFIGAIDLDQMVREGAMVETMTLGVNVETSGPLG